MKYVIQVNTTPRVNGNYFYGDIVRLDNGKKWAAQCPPEHAKRYSTRPAAERARDKLKDTCVNAANAEVREVER